MFAQEIKHCSLTKEILRKSRKAVLEDKSASFLVTYSFITLVLSFLGIYFISELLISFLIDIFPYNSINRYNAINSVRVFFAFLSVVLLAPHFTSFFAKSYALAKGKRTCSVKINFCTSVYLFSGIIIRFLFVVFSTKLLLSYTNIANYVSDYVKWGRDTVIVVSALVFSSLTIIALYKFTRFILVIFLFMKDPSTKYSTAVKTVKQHFKGHFFDFIFLNIRFLPIVFVSIISMGILMIYFIPHYAVSVSLLSDTILCDTRIKRKNYKFTYRLTEVNAK